MRLGVGVTDGKLGDPGIDAAPKAAEGRGVGVVATEVGGIRSAVGLAAAATVAAGEGVEEGTMTGTGVGVGLGGGVGVVMATDVA